MRPPHSRRDEDEGISLQQEHAGDKNGVSPLHRWSRMGPEERKQSIPKRQPHSEPHQQLGQPSDHRNILQFEQEQQQEP